MSCPGDPGQPLTSGARACAVEDSARSMGVIVAGEQSPWLCRLGLVAGSTPAVGTRAA